VNAIDPASAHFPDVHGHKYAWVRNHLFERIQNMEVGTRLPAEPILCEEYGVSRITLRKAVEQLVAEGYLRRDHGKGTFVTDPKYAMRYRERFVNEVTGFYTQMHRQGNQVESEVITQEKISAGPTVARQLGITGADEVIHLERLRKVNGTVHHLAQSYVVARKFPTVLTADFSTLSLYVHLRETYDLLLARNEILVSLSFATAREAEVMGVAEGDALLLTRSTVSDPEGNIIAYGTSKFVPSASELSFEVVADSIR
jgi:GntR family transcriptional regulator